MQLFPQAFFQLGQQRFSVWEELCEGGETMLEVIRARRVQTQTPMGACPYVKPISFHAFWTCSPDRTNLVGTPLLRGGQLSHGGDHNVGEIRFGSTLAGKPTQ